MRVLTHADVSLLFLVRPGLPFNDALQHVRGARGGGCGHLRGLPISCSSRHHALHGLYHSLDAHSPQDTTTSWPYIGLKRIHDT